MHDIIYNIFRIITAILAKSTSFLCLGITLVYILMGSRTWKHAPELDSLLKLFLNSWLSYQLNIKFILLIKYLFYF